MVMYILSDLHTHSLRFYGFYHLMFPLYPLPTPLFIYLLKTHQHVKRGDNYPHSSDPTPTSETPLMQLSIYLFFKSILA